LPTGKKGIMFSSNGMRTWNELAKDQADAAYAEGTSADKTVKRFSREEAVEVFLPQMSFLEGTDIKDSVAMIGKAYCSDARTVASVALKLGWAPMEGDEAWREGIRNDVKLLMKARPEAT